VLWGELYKMTTLTKAIIFDLDGTLLLRSDKNWKTDQLVLWLRYNGVKNPEQTIRNGRCNR